jgi:hypothetical protein
LSVLVLAAGAAISLALMWRAGRNNTSRLLIVVFAAWVLAPFVTLSLANVYSRRWRAGVQVPLQVASVIVTVGAVAAYSRVLPMLPSTKPAAVFLITPLASWAVIVASVAIGTVTSRPPRR